MAPGRRDLGPTQPQACCSEDKIRLSVTGRFSRDLSEERVSGDLGTPPHSGRAMWKGGCCLQKTCVECDCNWRRENLLNCTAFLCQWFLEGVAITILRESRESQGVPDPCSGSDSPWEPEENVLGVSTLPRGILNHDPQWFSSKTHI